MFIAVRLLPAPARSSFGWLLMDETFSSSGLARKGGIALPLTQCAKTEPPNSREQLPTIEKRPTASIQE